MNIQVDQSGKIEQTDKDTVLAFSNDKDFAILIPRRIKRQLQDFFRRKGQPQIFVYKVFSAGVVLLLRDYLNKVNRVTIDEEYFGKEKIIKSMIDEMLSRFSKKMPEVVFGRIGRKSRAHGIAYSVLSRKRKPDKILKLAEIKIIFSKSKQSRRRDKQKSPGT